MLKKSQMMKMNQNIYVYIENEGSSKIWVPGDRGLVRNSNPRVPLNNMQSILGQVLLVLVGFIT